ncbi:MAG TPA: hypothetical protein VFD58_08525 [Blastocatellia bacterium]|nr:hypothetical protein [Blastocatellia bacterium]
MQNLNNPARSGRNRLNKVLNFAIISLVLLVFAAILLPGWQSDDNMGSEAAAVQSLKTIHATEETFKSSKGRYGTLRELADARLIDRIYVSGRAVNKYIFSDSDVSADTFCIHADREKSSASYRDFNITESGDVYYIKSKNKGTVPWGEGTPILRDDGSSQ